MGLIDIAMASTFGNRRPPESVTLALFNGGKEVADSGYARYVIRKGVWEVRNGQISAACRFGPFHTATTFDRVAVLRGNDVVEEKVLLTPATVSPQMTYNHEYVEVWRPE